MYKNYYNLKRYPFASIPGSPSFFLSKTHQKALSMLKFGVLSQKGFVVMTGAEGTGKTALVNEFVKFLKPKIKFKVCVLSNPLLSPSEFIHYLALRFGLPYLNRTTFLHYFSNCLMQCAALRKKIVLIIDEAQVLSPDLFEEIKILSNLIDNVSDVLSIYFIGLPNLLERFDDESLQPIRQRISARCTVEPLTLQETFNYIFFRLSRAGAERMYLFSEKAMECIYSITKGNPRSINILCDYALFNGFSAGKPTIDDLTIGECANVLFFDQVYSSFNKTEPSKRVARHYAV